VTSGDLMLDGVRVNETSPGDRDLAMVFQSYALYPHMSVHENISFGLKVRAVSKEERERRVTEAAEMLGISALLHRKPAALSGGQRQRVAMARAIVRRPRAFLFDEPLSNLDAKLRLEVRAEIARLRRRFQTTTVYVTHDQVEAMTLADRVVVLHEGVVQQVGPPLEVFKRPKNRFVATFLGTPTMNVLARAQLGAALVPDNVDAIGARPHDVTARLPGTTPPPGHVKLGALEVDLIERLGQESFAFGMLSGTRVGAHLPDDTSNVAHGARLELWAPTSRLHFFGSDGSRVDA
jgi:sn-glycerol 3-phosphate transport system ATP-binding protein